jgi:hypothetical protein
MTRRELLARMDVEEFTYWLAKDRIDPIGPARQDAAADTIANVIVAVNTPSGKQFRARKYTPDYRKPSEAPVQTPEQLKAAVIKSNALMGGTFKRQ